MTASHPLADHEPPEAAGRLLKLIQARAGAVPNLFRQMAHAPAVLEATLSLRQATHQALPPGLRELAYLKTSHLNGCRY